MKQLGVYTIVETDHDCAAGCKFCTGLDRQAEQAKKRHLMFHHLLPSANGQPYGACFYSQNLALLRDLVAALFCQKTKKGAM